MTDAAKVQALPTTAINSEDVLDDLLCTMGCQSTFPLVSKTTGDELKARVALGEKKYGSRLKTNNGRDVILDLRQELLDGVMYSHQAVMQGERVAHVRNQCLRLLQELELYQKAMGR